MCTSAACSRDSGTAQAHSHCRALPRTGLSRWVADLSRHWAILSEWSVSLGCSPALRQGHRAGFVQQRGVAYR